MRFQKKSVIDHLGSITPNQLAQSARSNTATANIPLRYKASVSDESTVKEPYIAFTVSLSPDTYISGNEHVETDYQDLEPEEQRKFLLDRIVVAWNLFLDKFKAESHFDKYQSDIHIYFEHCKDGRVHAHGYFDFPIQRCNKTNCAKFGTIFWNQLSDRQKWSNIKGVSLCIKIVDSISKWKDYCTKEQGDNELNSYYSVYTFSPFKFTF